MINEGDLQIIADHEKLSSATNFRASSLARVGCAAYASNENKMSYGGRERVWQTQVTLSQNQMCASRRPAVGSSEWLDLYCALMCCEQVRSQIQPTLKTKISQTGH